jgi:DNA-binding NarL/FixJ family response regulator
MTRRTRSAGALAYVLKLTAADELVLAVRMAIRGQRHMSPRLRDPPG